MSANASAWAQPRTRTAGANAGGDPVDDHGTEPRARAMTHTARGGAAATWRAIEAALRRLGRRAGPVPPRVLREIMRRVRAEHRTQYGHRARLPAARTRHRRP